MVYGYFITDTAGNKSFITEGCVHCHITTGGQHEDKCPMKDIEIPKESSIADKPAGISNIRRVRILKYDDYGNFIKEL